MSVRIIIFAVLFAAFTQVGQPTFSPDRTPGAISVDKVDKSSELNMLVQQSTPEFKYLPVRRG